jgi:hypothetical protein
MTDSRTISQLEAEGYAKGHSFVIPKIEFSKIPLQMLLADIVTIPLFSLEIFPKRNSGRLRTQSK